eukprot:g19484.t1
MPDARGLWDVQIDGSAAPVKLRSPEICDEATGKAFVDPVQIGDWKTVPEEKALYARVTLQEGEVILEDEPAISAPFSFDMPQLRLQFNQMSPSRQDAILQLSKGPDFLASLRSETRHFTKETLQSASPEFRRLEPVHCDGRTYPDMNPTDFAFDTPWPRAELLRGQLNESLQDQIWSMMRTSQLLYPTLARVNHSCRPNAVLGDPKPAEQDAKLHSGLEPVDLLKKALIAIEEIPEGEEITVSYLSEEDLLEPRPQRRQRLMDGFGFECFCSRCLDEDADRVLRTFRSAEGEGSTDAVAWGSFTDVIDKTGWAVLDIHTAPSANGDTQSYAAGFLEGADGLGRARARITQHLQNMWGVDFKGYAAGTVPEKIRDFVSANMDWMVSKVKENPSDSYWQTIGYLLAQLHGLADGYEAARDADGYNGLPLTVEETCWKSWLGGLYSADDFYVLDSKLVVMETTIDNYNRSLWSQIKPESVMTWARAMVANRQATSGDEWTEHQVRHSSGTCNNQWMVVDYKRFEPGRQEGAGSSLSSLMALIRYNRIDDPLARGDACNGISARCDLNPHKHVSYDCFGAIDAKIARWRNFSEDLSFLAVSSPTWGGNERPFSWSEVNPEVDGCQASDHRGHPNTFDFSWYQTLGDEPPGRMPHPARPDQRIPPDTSKNAVDRRVKARGEARRNKSWAP